MTDQNRKNSARRLSRRAAIQALIGAGTLAAISGCRAVAPAPTPTPTRTPRIPTPTGTPIISSAPVSPLATPTAAATATTAASPTASVTPLPTDTPAPTATPTPTATLFPPGQASKLGLFITRNDPRIFDLLRTENVTLVKTLEYDPNFVTEMKSISPKTLIVGRMDVPQVNLAEMVDPKAAAQAFADQLLPIATEPRRLAAIDAWETFNEPAPSDPDQMSRLAEFEARRVRAVRKRRYSLVHRQLQRR